MAKKTVRDNVYFEDRLKRDHPTIYADLKAGKYRTVTDAALAAGLKTKRTRLHELKNAWEKASRAEQREFLNWLREDIKSSPPVVPSGPSTPIAIERKLIPDAAARIRDIMSRRALTMGDVMAEIGFLRLDASVGMALHRGTKLQPEMIAALEKWLDANTAV
ncbi:hypothetical protein F9L00_16840 [Brucella anthropi]|uniref:hypothetical protein n=1 Tax=Brucella anthropi TaxID=529 RepID=UPI00124DF286|nr:hypothetical protein [Brucella anthropi]KAB2759539.1 hypothetical protein F9K98_21085 [Brucella anthropi]KAB2775334.1 hypothetical protein F9L00_16840 [Brucella anthropi]UGQ20867.1 hypothetical protein LRL11_12365 [Brucella anthropi]